MKKLLIAAVIAVAILVVGGVLLSSNDDNDKRSPGSNSAQNQTNTGSSDQSVTPGKVEITDNMIFTPSQITVQKGATVTWTNNDDTVHTVTNDLEGNGPSSGDIKPGASYTYTFTNTGSYQYHCDIHHQMRGTIVVK